MALTVAETQELGDTGARVVRLTGYAGIEGAGARYCEGSLGLASSPLPSPIPRFHAWAASAADVPLSHTTVPVADVANDGGGEGQSMHSSLHLGGGASVSLLHNQNPSAITPTPLPPGWCSILKHPPPLSTRRTSACAIDDQDGLPVKQRRMRQHKLNHITLGMTVR